MKDINQRIEWIDIAKGIGIILVIAGHTFQLSYISPIYSFHMPLFFFLTGLVLNVDKYRLLDFLRVKSRQLLKPYIIILLISLFICMNITAWRNMITWDTVLKDIYTSNTNVFQNSSLWYLPCLFISLLLFFFLNKCCNSTKARCITLFIISILVLWIKPILEVLPIPLHRLPFKLDSSFIAIIFVSFAVWFKQVILSYFKTPPPNLTIIGVIVLSAIFAFFNGWANMNSLDFGRIKLLYFPIAALGIISICLISVYISVKTKLNKIKSILLFYGTNTLIIFGFQSLFIRLYILIMNQTFDLNMTLYGANPIIHQIGSFLIVTFILSPFIVLIFKLFRNCGINLL